MAIIDLQAVPLGNGFYKLTWSDTLTGQTYYVYRDGLLLATLGAPEYIVAIQAADSPVFDVLDDPNAVPLGAFPSQQLLTWYPTPATDQYRIDKLIAGNWVEQAIVPDEGRLTFLWKTQPLAEGQVHTFRVVPIGTNGNAGTPLQFVALCVRFPDPPVNTEMTFNIDRTVTIAAL